jgi:hypothetical protein
MGKILQMRKIGRTCAGSILIGPVEPKPGSCGVFLGVNVRFGSILSLKSIAGEHPSLQSFHRDLPAPQNQKNDVELQLNASGTAGTSSAGLWLDGFFRRSDSFFFLPLPSFFLVSIALVFW